MTKNGLAARDVPKWQKNESNLAKNGLAARKATKWSKTCYQKQHCRQEDLKMSPNKYIVGPKKALPPEGARMAQNGLNFARSCLAARKAPKCFSNEPNLNKNSLTARLTGGARLRTRSPKPESKSV